MREFQEIRSLLSNPIPTGGHDFKTGVSEAEYAEHLDAILGIALSTDNPELRDTTLAYVERRYPHQHIEVVEKFKPLLQVESVPGFKGLEALVLLSARLRVPWLKGERLNVTTTFYGEGTPEVGRRPDGQFFYGEEAREYYPEEGFDFRPRREVSEGATLQEKMEVEKDWPVIVFTIPEDKAYMVTALEEFPSAYEHMSKYWHPVTMAYELILRAYERDSERDLGFLREAKWREAGK